MTAVVPGTANSSWQRFGPPRDGTRLSRNARLQSSVLVDEPAETVSSGKYKPVGWLAASVPSTVLSVLVKNGVYPDPRVGMNAYQIPDSSDDFNRRHEGKIQGIAPQALKILMEYDWPGNVREIKNAVESAAVLATGETIGPEGFAELLARSSARSAPALTPSFPPPTGSVVIALGTPLAEVERQLILATLRQYGSRAPAAKTLGTGLRTLYTKLREYSAT